VTIEVAGECQTARLTDVGAGGLGVSGVEIRCARGEPMLVTLPSGRRLHGEVRWQRDDKLGLALYDPLAFNDDLFGAASASRFTSSHRHH
jgi:hypothetical protein